MSLTNQVAIITGGGSGIGRNVSLRFAELGCAVVIGDTNDQQGRSVAEEIVGGGGKAHFVRCDVTNQEQLENLFKEAWKNYGRLDIVCNNAGIAGESNFAESLDFSYTKILDINLTAVIRGTQLGIHYIKKSGRGGVIINTASLAGLVPQIFQPVYAATKSGVVHFTRSLAHLAQSDGIRVVAICPGFVDTPLTQPIRDIIANTYKDTLMPTHYVTEGFVELALDKHQKGGGAIMRITTKLGRDYPGFFNRKAGL